MAGSGNASYIHRAIRRDTDTNTAWTSASEGTVDQRRHLVQNQRADVTTMLSTSGEPVEWSCYSAYGTPISHPIADINGDGTVNVSDVTAWINLQNGDGSGSVWRTDDLNRDDLYPDSSDDTFFYVQYDGAHLQWPA